MKKKRAMKGDLPVPYIVAIVIAILVIVVLVLFFLGYFHQTTITATEAVCRAREVAYCTSWAATGYDPEKLPDKKDFTESNPDCAAYSWAKSVSANPNECKALP